MRVTTYSGTIRSLRWTRLLFNGSRGFWMRRRARVGTGRQPGCLIGHRRIHFRHSLRAHGGCYRGCAPSASLPGTGPGACAGEPRICHGARYPARPRHGHGRATHGFLGRTSAKAGRDSAVRSRPKAQSRWVTGACFARRQNDGKPGGTSFAARPQTRRIAKRHLEENTEEESFECEE